MSRRENRLCSWTSEFSKTEFLYHLHTPLQSYIAGTDEIGIRSKKSEYQEIYQLYHIILIISSYINHIISYHIMNERAEDTEQKSSAEKN